MEIVNFKPQSDFADKAQAAFEKERGNLLKILPEADIQHIGSTAIPNAMTKGDLDLQVRVEKADFQEAVEKLKKLYAINQPDNWTENYASFKDDNRSIGIQLTVRGSYDDSQFQEQQRLLSNSPEVLERYNKMKLGFEGKNIKDYRAARSKFFEELKAEGLLH
jgi:GrpB-like predicted nucleotidyltransferase (UPF0157 family)